MTQISWFDDKLQRDILTKLANHYPLKYHFNQILEMLNMPNENRVKLHKNIQYLCGLGLLTQFSPTAPHIFGNDDLYSFDYLITSIGIANVLYPTDILYQSIVKDS